MKYKTALIFLIMLFSGYITMAQHHHCIRPVEKPNENPQNFHVVAFEFIDTLTGQVINRFDVIQNNPYNHLNYKVIDTNNWGNNDYEMGIQSIDDLIPPSKRTFYEYKCLGCDSVSLNAESIVNFYTDSLNNIVIAYTLFYGIYNFGSIGDISQIVVLNNKGEMLYSIDSLYFNVNHIIITKNAEFVGISYGDLYDGYTLITEGFCILKGMNIVFQIKESLCDAKVFENIFVIGEKNIDDRSIYKLSVFFPSENYLIKGSLPFISFCNIASVSKKGIMIHDVIGLKFLKFDQSFEKKKF